MSQEVNNDKTKYPTKRALLDVLNNVCKVKKKNINFEQYARFHFDGPKIAICETISDTVSVQTSSFTSKDNYFCVAIDKVCEFFAK